MTAKTSAAHGAARRAGHRAAVRPRRPAAAVAGSAGRGQEAIGVAVGALGYELVDVEHAPRGLLRVTIDRVPGRRYATGESDAVTVDDCEAVTRQLQYVLEVEGVDYARLEVSSPGLDRALKRAADYERFVGHAVAVTLKAPFEGRKSFKGVLGRAAAQGDAAGGQGSWTLTFDEGKGAQVFGFMLDEVREARLVPVVDFKGRRGKAAAGAAPEPAAPQDGG